MALRQLPAESKVYFRHSVVVPARTERVWLISELEGQGVKADLMLPKAEVDRFIDPSTPLLVDRIESPTTSRFQPSCMVTLHLKTASGMTMQLRASRSATAGICAPPTVGDLAPVAIIVAAPPVPIQ